MKLSLCSQGEETTPRFLEECHLAEILGFRAMYHTDEKWTRDGFVLGSSGSRTRQTGGLIP